MIDWIYSFSAFVANHTLLVYTILFFGAILEATFPVSLFIYGEIFFIGGALLAGTGALNIWVVTFLSVSGGILGDNLSYFLGRKYGFSLIKNLENRRFFNKIFSPSNIKRGEDFFKKYGGMSVFIARFGGPLCRITPFFAGSFRLRYRDFLLFEVPGAIGGISLFILTGYFFGRYFESVLKNIYIYLFLLIFIFSVAFITYRSIKNYLKKAKNRKLLQQKKRYLLKLFAQHIFLYTLSLLLIYALFLYLIFFIFESKQKNEAMMGFDFTLTKVDDIAQKTNFLTNFPSSKKTTQPINLVFIGDQEISQLFLTKLHWLENTNFSENDISIKKYITLFKQKQLPISTLLLNNTPQNVSLQLPSVSNLNRTHIRFWNFGKLNGKYVYLATVSDDTEVELVLYNHFPAPLHEISPDIDTPRERVVREFISLLPQTQLEYKKWTDTIAHNIETKYFTDGRVAILQF